MKDSTTNTAARELPLDQGLLGRQVSLSVTITYPGSRVSDIKIGETVVQIPNSDIRATITQQQGGEQEAGDGDRQARELWARELRAKGMVCEAVGVTYGPWDQKEDAAIRAISAALRSKQPAASEGDERREYDAFAGAINVLLSHGIATSKAVEIARDLSDNTSEQAAGEAVELEQFRPAVVNWRNEQRGTIKILSESLSPLGAGAQKLAEGRLREAERLIAIIDAPPRHPADEGTRDAARYRWRRHKMTCGSFTLTEELSVVGAKSPQSFDAVVDEHLRDAALQAGTP